MNWFWTMLLGIGGAIVGGWIGMLLGINTDAGLVGWVAAIGGAILLLVLYHWATAYRSAVRGPATSDDFAHDVIGNGGESCPRAGSAEQGGWVSRRFGCKEPSTTVVWQSAVRGVTVLRTRITYTRTRPIGL